MIIKETNFDKWYVPDCLMNSLIPIIEKKNISTDVVYCDYYAFTYYRDTRSIGENYALPHNTAIYLREEYLDSINDKYRYIEFMPIKLLTDHSVSICNSNKDRIQVYRFICNDNDLAWNVLKETIQQGEIFVCAVDIFYMPYHEYYKKKHAIHYIDIINYDDNNYTVEIEDLYQFTNSNYRGNISFAELENGRSSKNPVNEDMFGISGVEIRNLWVTVTVPNCFNECLDESQIISGSLNKMTDNKRQANTYCGLEGMRQWIYDLETTKTVQKDVVKMTQEYMYELRVACISLQKSRYRFRNLINSMTVVISPEIQFDLVNKIEYISKCWLCLSNLFYRYWAKPSETIFDRIIDNLYELLECDKELYQKLDAFMRTNKV